MWFARRFGLEPIIAVEPSHGSADLLKRNFKQNAIAGEVIVAAVGPVEGTAESAELDQSNLSRLQKGGIQFT